MRREVHNEYTDKVFRNKILKQEQGPVRAGEAMPPPFDWSAMPEAVSTMSQAASAPSIFNLTTVLWSAFVVIVIAVIAISIYGSEPAAVIDQPTKPLENIPASENTVTAQLDERQESIIDDASGTSDHASGASLGLIPKNTDDLFGASTDEKERVSEEEKQAIATVGHDEETVAAESNEEKATSRSKGEAIAAGQNEEEDASGSNDVILQAEPSAVIVDGENKTLNLQVDEPQAMVKGESILPSSEQGADGSKAALDDRKTASSVNAGDVFVASDGFSDFQNKVEAIHLIPSRDISSSIEVSDNKVMPVPGLTVTASQIQARNRFELRLFTTINRGYRALSGNGANEKIVQRINESESASVNVGVGLSFGWRINSRWTILTGVSQRATTINSQFSKQVIYDKAKEVLNADDNFENSSEFEFETSAGPSVAVTRYAWRRLQDVLRNGDRLDFEFNFSREYKSVIIPLQVQYNIVNNGFKVGVIAGAQYARIYKTETRADRPKALIRLGQMPMPIHRDGRDFFARNTLDVLAPDQRLNKNIVEASVGLHLGYQLGKSVEVYVQPSYSHGLNKMYSSGNFSTTSTNKQIDAGIVLSF